MFQVIRNEWAAASFSTRVFIVFMLIVSATGLALVYFASSRWLSDPLEGDRDTMLRETSMVDTNLQERDAAQRNRYRMQQHQILRQHFDATGGAKILSSTVSLRFSGTVTFEDGTRQEIIVTKKGGDSIRISIGTRLMQTTICVSPGDSWRSLSRINDIIAVENLPEEEARGHRRYLYVVSELFLASVNGWKMEFLGIREFRGELAYQFDVVVSADHHVSFFIDPESFLNVGRLDRISNGDGTSDVTIRVHSDHFQAEGLVIPGRVETYSDGKLDQVLIIENALRNGGVLDTVFERPVVTP